MGVSARLLPPDLLDDVRKKCEEESSSTGVFDSHFGSKCVVQLHDFYGPGLS